MLSTSNTGSGICTDKYKILYFNIDSLDQADTLLFAENHSSKECEKLNGDFISSIARSHIVSVFVEGVNSMKELQFRFVEGISSLDDMITLKNLNERLKSRTCIDSAIKDENLIFYGWDAIDEELSLANKKKNSIFICLLGIDEQKNETEDKIGVLTNAQKTIIPDYPTFDLNTFCRLPEIDYETFLNNCNELICLKNNLKGLKEKLAQLEDQYLHATKQLEILVTQHFPKRTNAMTGTLQKIRNMSMEGVLTGKAVFVAGLGHLETLEKDKDKIEYDLSPLYQELQHHKAAILIPHTIEDEKAYQLLQLKPGASVEEMDKQYRQLAKQKHPDTIARNLSKSEVESEQVYQQRLKTAIEAADKEMSLITGARDFLRDHLKKQSAYV
jgi:DnaJ domain